MDIFDKTDAESVDNIGGGELATFFLSGHGEDRSDQKCKDGEEESADHDFRYEYLRIDAITSDNWRGTLDPRGLYAEQDAHPRGRN